MGLFSRSENVRGWARIVSTSPAPSHASSGICTMQVIVQAEGIPATHVETMRLCSVRTWPQPGTAVPCELDPRRPEDAKLLWDEVGDYADQAGRQAALLTQQLNAQRPTGPGSSGSGPG